MASQKGRKNSTLVPLAIFRSDIIQPVTKFF